MSDIARMLRVDQAGEYGATRIYAGQLAVMGDRAPHVGEIAHMAEQEDAHRQKFDALIAKRGVRPTALQPVWSVAGYALGAATALIGPKAAMACTQQLEELGDEDPELAAMIREFRDDERAHKEAAIAAGAEQAPAYPLLSGAIRLGCRLAIRLSERI
jgi:ubiquinone biosynthesis monooxygenase Coq7